MTHRKCWYSGHVFIDGDFANFTRQELMARVHSDPAEEPEGCASCGARRRLQWVKRSLGGRGSGLWAWSLIYPHHTRVEREDLTVSSMKHAESDESL